jgi:hypothetical protein
MCIYSCKLYQRCNQGCLKNLNHIRNSFKMCVRDVVMRWTDEKNRRREILSQCLFIKFKNILATFIPIIKNKVKLLP